jgi:hypothetical protein
MPMVLRARCSRFRRFARPGSATFRRRLFVCRWIRASENQRELPQYNFIASWEHIASRSYLPESLSLFQTSDTAEYTTPEQLAGMWNSWYKSVFTHVTVRSNHAVTLCNGADAWTDELDFQDHRGAQRVIESMYAYANDALYVLEYGRYVQTPENPAARKALFSLCPPSAAPSPAP